MENKAALAQGALQRAFEFNLNAMVITDMGSKIVAVNRAFEKLTEYRYEEVAGKDPKVLSAGMTDRLTYAQMWESLDAQGWWEGELLDRKKGGEVYSKHLRIDRVPGVGYVGQFMDITDRKRTEERAKMLERLDPLTGLQNKTAFMEQAEAEAQKAKASGSKVAVVHIDLSGFKRINETMGMRAGDEALKEVSCLLAQVADSEQLLCRWSADKFLMLLPEADGIRLNVATSKVLSLLGNPLHLAQGSARVMANLGVSMYPSDGEKLLDLALKAEQAVGIAKSMGPGKVYFYDEKDARDNAEIGSIEQELLEALETRALDAWLQPKFSCDGKELCGYEALARWKRKDGSQMPPGKFVRVAELCGHQDRLDMLVASKAMEIFLSLPARAREACVLAVNASPKSIGPDFAVRWLNLAKACGLEAQKLEIEITETAVASNAAEVARQLGLLRKAGVRIALDDFGVGQSSLSMLKGMPLDTIKIDKAFVDSLPGDGVDAAIVDAAINVAKKLGLSTVAEGVERPEQAQDLMRRGCDKIQGYLYAKPMDAQALRGWLAEFFEGLGGL